MYVLADHPAFARPYVGVHWSTLLMSSSLLLQQCPACLVRLTWIVFVMGGKWPYRWCFVGFCCQDLFNIARNILVYLLSNFFSSCFVSLQVVHPYKCIIPALHYCWRGFPIAYWLMNETEMAYYVQLRYCFKIWTNVREKSMSHYPSPDMGWTLLVMFYQYGFDIK